MKPSRPLLFLLGLLLLAPLVTARAAQTDPPTPTPEEPSPPPAQSLVPLDDIQAVSAGALHSCVLTRGGALKCWGSNDRGQLGDGTTDARSTPVDVLSLTDRVVAFSAGYEHTCAVGEDGRAKCWGANRDGQLGNGSTEDSSAPVDVIGLPEGVAAIAAGQRHTCALTLSGGVYCWGDNLFNRLGDGSDEDSPKPVPALGLASGVQAIAVGWNHSCALKTDSSVVCWGATGFLGVASFDKGPLIVPGLESGVSAIAVGPTHTCALKGKQVLCWGANQSGQLGNGEQTTVQFELVAVSGLLEEVTALAPGGFHSCALADGRVFCWGGNSFGQLGDGTSQDRLSPVGVQGLDGDTVALSAGLAHTCAVLSTGRVECWGLDRGGLLGGGRLITGEAKPVQVVGLSEGVGAISAGETSTCAVVGGRVVCWGINDSLGLALDLASGSSINPGVPQEVQEFSGTAQAVAVGSSHACSISSSGGVSCWGSNHNGQLGNGSTERADGPVQVVSLSSEVIELAAGDDHTCALKAEGAVFCWGQNYSGQLGDGTVEHRSSPVAVAGLPVGVNMLSAGGDRTCAVTTGREIYCWGDNSFSLLAAETWEDQNSAVAASDIPGPVLGVAVGGDHLCVIVEGGDVWCWGNNDGGQLGQGSTEEQEGPVRVPGIGEAVEIAASFVNTCALTRQGDVYCWGVDISMPFLDDQTPQFDSEPRRVQGLPRDIAVLAAGYLHMCALTDGGGVFCWGNNESGQLGDDSLFARSPVEVVIAQPAEVGAYREPSTFVPELTTYIPTPLDVSTDPKVVGTNLTLAALAMLPFALAAELLTRTLGVHPPAMAGRFSPMPRFAAAQVRLRGALRRLIPPQRLREAGRFAFILLFYGLVFSLLDRTWKPFTLDGLVLLLYMTVAYGIVGLADDIAQWRVARRWQIPAKFNLRPTNVLLAVASTATTRLLKLVPGLMFGTPEAFEVEEAGLDEPAKARLARVSALALLAVGFGIWIPSALTAGLRDRGISGGIATALGGLEAFLVLTFAVALENIFVKMLGLPGSMGEALKRRNRWLWMAGLVASGFAFYHTLLNPRGELATAFKEGNVQLFLGAVAAFVLVSFSLWLYFRWRERGISLHLKLPTLPKRARAAPARVDVAPSISPPLTMEQAPLMETAVAAEPAPLPALEAAAPAPKFEGTTVIPPVTTEPDLGGSPPGVAPVAEQVEDEVAQAGPALPDTEAAGETSPVGTVAAQLPEVLEGTKKCPMCAETIKLEARICRYCRTGFEVTVQGYCTRDHAVVALDPRDRCTRCGGEVIDRQVKSVWLGEDSGVPIVPIGREATPFESKAARAAVASILPAARTQPAAPPVRAGPRRRRVVGAGKVILPAAGVATVALGALLVARNLGNGLQAPAVPEAGLPAGLPISEEATGVPLPTATPRPTQTTVPTQTPAPTRTPTPQPAWVNDFAAPILTAVADREPDFDYGYNPADWGPPWLDFQEGRLRVEQSDAYLNVFLRERGLYDFVETLDVTFERRGATIVLQWYGSLGEIRLDVTAGTSGGWDWQLSSSADGDFIYIGSGRATAVSGLSASITLIRYRHEIAAFINGEPLAYTNDPDIPATYYCVLQVLEKPPDAPANVVWFDHLRMWDLRMVPGLP